MGFMFDINTVQIESDEDIWWTPDREKKEEVAARGRKFLEW